MRRGHKLLPRVPAAPLARFMCSRIICTGVLSGMVNVARTITPACGMLDLFWSLRRCVRVHPAFVAPLLGLWMRQAVGGIE